MNKNTKQWFNNLQFELKMQKNVSFIAIRDDDTAANGPYKVP